MAGALAAAGLAFPASAQVAIEAALQTDYRVRGYSVSDGEPTASVSVSYDDPSGIYVGGLAIATLRDGDPALLGIQGSAGYAVRLTPRLSLDGGVARTEYFYGYGTARNYHYTEAYVGIALPHVAARLSYSPDYYRAGVDTLYAEVDAGFEPAPNWFLSAHAGVLTYLDAPPPYSPRTRYDWRVGASRQFGPYAVHLDVSGRIVAEPDGYRLPYPLTRITRDRTAAVLSLTRSF
jgi:uncharacterized protein (TIGR02001 family)